MNVKKILVAVGIVAGLGAGAALSLMPRDFKVGQCVAPKGQAPQDGDPVAQITEVRKDSYIVHLTLSIAPGVIMEGNVEISKADGNAKLQTSPCPQ